MTCFAHQTVVDASAHFKEQLNRINYVTPMSYMEMLGAYAEMFKKKQKAILTESNALKTGYYQMFLFSSLLVMPSSGQKHCFWVLLRSFGSP